MGARVRLRDLRGRAGVGAPRADRAEPLRKRDRPGRTGDAARRGVVVVLVRGRRDREVALPEGRVGRDRARVPVRLDEPRLGARPRDLDPHGLAVHARRVRRRDRADRIDVGPAAPVRVAATRGGGPRARARSRHGPPAPLGGLGAALAQAARVRGGVVRRRAQLPRRLADALAGDRNRLRARRVRSARPEPLVLEALPRVGPEAASHARERHRRPGHRGAHVRVLGRERAARRRALVGGASRSPA